MGYISQKWLRRRPKLQFQFGIFVKGFLLEHPPNPKKQKHFMSSTSWQDNVLCSDNFFNHFGVSPYCPSSLLNTTTGSAFIFKQLVDAIKQHRAGEFINSWQAHVVRRLDTRWHVLDTRWKMTIPVCLKHKGAPKLLPVVECWEIWCRNLGFSKGSWSCLVFQPYCHFRLMSKVIQLITLGWFNPLLQFDGRRTTILTYLNWLVRFCSSAVWMGFS